MHLEFLVIDPWRKRLSEQTTKPEELMEGIKSSSNWVKNHIRSLCFKDKLGKIVEHFVGDNNERRCGGGEGRRR
jgi:hypothetical protein